jgi:hypothetical protein
MILVARDVLTPSHRPKLAETYTKLAAMQALAGIKAAPLSGALNDHTA